MDRISPGGPRYRAPTVLINGACIHNWYNTNQSFFRYGPPIGFHTVSVIILSKSKLVIVLLNTLARNSRTK